MNALARCIRAETYKLSHRAKYRVFAILLLAGYALRQLLNVKITGNMAMIRAFGDGGLVFGGFMLYIYLPLIAFMAVNDLFASEIKQKSVRACLMRPIRRASLYMGKCLAAIGMCMAHALLLILADSACAVIPGLEPLGDWRQALWYLIDMVPLLSLACFAALINILAPNPAFSMLLCIALYAGLAALGFAFGLTQALFTGYMSWHTLFIGHMMPFSALLPRLAAVFGSMAFFAGAGVLMFTNKQF